MSSKAALSYGSGYGKGQGVFVENNMDKTTWFGIARVRGYEGTSLLSRACHSF